MINTLNFMFDRNVLHDQLNLWGMVGNEDEGLILSQELGAKNRTQSD